MKFNIPAIALILLLATGSALADDRLLWDSWYTVTIRGPKQDHHYGYYNDRAEVKKDRVHFQNRYWKNEEGYINEENIGGFSEDTAELKPLFFNAHTSYRGTETRIDGTIDGNKLSVRVQRGGKDLPIIKKNLPKKLILSNFFPIWIGKKLPGLKLGQTASFMAILEDGVESDFSTQHGKIRLEKGDPYSEKSKTQKLAVDFADQRSIWYVEKTGMPVRIEIPGRNIVTEKVTMEKAKKFLDQE